MKHFIQYTTKLEALVKRQSALATVILLIYLEKHMIQWKLFETLKSQPCFYRSSWYLYNFSKWLSHYLCIKCI